MPNFAEVISKAAKNAKIEISGISDIKNEAQAKVGLAAIRAFGDSPLGLIFFEPCVTFSNCRPPDILIGHSKIGLLLIKVEKWSIDQIEQIREGNIVYLKDSVKNEINPFSMIDESKLNIFTAVNRQLLYGDYPVLTTAAVSFPNISRSSLNNKGFINSLHMQNLILMEDLQDNVSFMQKIKQLIDSHMNEPGNGNYLSSTQFSAIRLALRDSAVVNEFRNLPACNGKWKIGAKILELVQQEKVLTEEQQQLSRIDIKGYPRVIRGVAGSGKTVVLANVAARYLDRSINSGPEAPWHNSSIRAVALCYNRSLVQFIKKKIKSAYHQQTGQDRPPGRLQVNYLNGLMYKIRTDTKKKFKYLSTEEYKDAASRALVYIENLSKLETENNGTYQSCLYDAIFIDEGQDLLPEEYKLLIKLVKPNMATGEKNIIIFYDDAQNMYGRPRYKWKDFGIEVNKGDRARVMKLCCRNTREILDLAFNVLIGKQAPEDRQVEMGNFADVNTLKKNELVYETETHFRVNFTQRKYEKPQIQTFRTSEEEKQWIANEVVRLIYEEEVRPEDILILFSYEAGFEDLCDKIRERDLNAVIQGFVKPFGKNDADKDSYIFRDGHLTISTTNGAKGYDAYVVFLAGANTFKTDEEGRASFYVGATRSKLVLYVSGVQGEKNLLSEAVELSRIL